MPTNWALCSLSFFTFLKLAIKLFILNTACLFEATSYMSDVWIVREWKKNATPEEHYGIGVVSNYTQN